jgi:membrane-bound serine protease (ClpP class)
MSELQLLGVVALFGLGFALIIAEMFLPGVVLGLAGTACVVGALYVAFSMSLTLGLILSVITVLTIPVLVVLWVKVINRVLAIKETQVGYTSAQVEHKDFVGREGVAVTMLRPSGSARIAGKKLAVVSEGPVIDKDTRVKVVRVDSNRVVVRAVRG